MDNSPTMLWQQLCSIQCQHRDCQAHLHDDVDRYEKVSQDHEHAAARVEELQQALNAATGIEKSLRDEKERLREQLIKSTQQFAVSQLVERRLQRALNQSRCHQRSVVVFSSPEEKTLEARPSSRLHNEDEGSSKSTVEVLDPYTMIDTASGEQLCLDAITHVRHEGRCVVDGMDMADSMGLRLVADEVRAGYNYTFLCPRVTHTRVDECANESMGNSIVAVDVCLRLLDMILSASSALTTRASMSVLTPSASHVTDLLDVRRYSPSEQKICVSQWADLYQGQGSDRRWPITSLVRGDQFTSCAGVSSQGLTSMDISSVAEAAMVLRQGLARQAGVLMNASLDGATHCPGTNSAKTTVVLLMLETCDSGCRCTSTVAFVLSCGTTQSASPLLAYLGEAVSVAEGCIAAMRDSPCSAVDVDGDDWNSHSYASWQKYSAAVQHKLRGLTSRPPLGAVADLVDQTFGGDSKAVLLVEVHEDSSPSTDQFTTPTAPIICDSILAKAIRTAHRFRCVARHQAQRHTTIQ